MTASDSFIFISGKNKDQQDMPVRQKSNASEGFNSTNIASKVVWLEKEARKHLSDSQPNDRDMPADESAKEPNKGLTG